MAVSSNKTNLVCRSMLETREVLEGQIVAIVMSSDGVKSLPTKEKKDLSKHIRSSIIQQFDSLIDRTQKTLS